MPPIVLHLPTQTTNRQEPETQGPAGNIYALADLAVFQATGADAVSFLQGQITNDIASGSTNLAKLAGYCTAQGRLLATMVLNVYPDQVSSTPMIIGLLKKDLGQAVIKRLNMFILRSKVKLSLTETQVYGIKTSEDQVLMLEKMLSHDLPRQPWQTIHAASGTWISAPSFHGYRVWWMATSEQIEQHNNIFNACTSRSANEWHAFDIQCGLPWIEASTQDLFIPQTLNLDLIDGVSFTKGCYPGQEIVARSHYRGTLKRRMNLGYIESLVNITPGSDIFDQHHPEQPCGRLINAAQDESVTRILFEATFEATGHNALRLGSADGPGITLDPLPYDLQPSKA